MKTFFNDDWKHWIKTNVNAGRDKNGIFKILLDEGYSFDAIADEMNFTPTLPINRLVNPLRPERTLQTSPSRKKLTNQSSASLYQRIPIFHPIGFEKARMSSALFGEICAFYQSARAKAEDEHVPGEFIVNEQQRKKSSLLVNLPTVLGTKIHDYMLPIMGDWCGKVLDPTYVYGVRTYLRGAKLKCHRDRIETHIISAIINVDQKADEPWPLTIDDHNDKEHQVFLEPGEMVFYEGARLRHGRPTPFVGQEFANIFCHFKPTDYKAPTLNTAV